MPSASSDSEVQITPPSWYIDSSSGNLRLWLLNSQSLRHSHVWLYLPLGKLCFLRNAIFVRSYTIVAWLKPKSFRRGKKKVCWVLFNNILKPTCAPILYTEKVIGRYDFTFFTVELLSSHWKKKHVTYIAVIITLSILSHHSEMKEVASRRETAEDNGKMQCSTESSEWKPTR